MNFDVLWHIFLFLGASACVVSSASVVGGVRVWAAGVWVVGEQGCFLQVSVCSLSPSPRYDVLHNDSSPER